MTPSSESQPIYVFAGPTLSADEGRKHLDAVFLGPAAQGDVYSAVRTRPFAIGIIDGYFERVPAVWHKEILWAMDQGVHVFGSASMGALRAAELDRFGMVGVGSVYRDFADGTLEDDDEVTVVHGPPESGYIVTSDAMVNIRATLRAAPGLSDALRSRLIEIAKSIHYRERRYETVLRRAREEDLPEEELDALAKWLVDGRIDQKRNDALEMLAAMEAHRNEGLDPKRVRYVFQHTDAWDKVRRMIDRRPLDAEPGADTYVVDAVTDELRLRPDLLHETWARATTRTLALSLARSERSSVDEKAFEHTVARFCRSHGLEDSEALEAWLQSQALSPHDFTGLMSDESLVATVLTFVRGETRRQLASTLRLDGSYADLAARARLKEEALALRGLQAPSLERAGMTEAELWGWYFAEHLQRPVPDDIGSYAREHHFENTDTFRQAVLREYFFSDSVDPTGSPV